MPYDNRQHRDSRNRSHRDYPMPHPRSDNSGSSNSRPTPTDKGNRITGSDDALFLKKRYQQELDNANMAIVNHVHRLEEKTTRTKQLLNDAERLKHDIQVHQDERNDLYNSLGNLLNKETDFEKGMWQTTQKSAKVNNIHINQRFKESDVDEMRFSSMLDYLRQYPIYASKPTFKAILEHIQQKEREIRYKKENYNRSVSLYNTEVLEFEKELQKTDDKFSAYEKILKEGMEKLDGCRYKKSIFFKLANEETKHKVSLDILDHRVEQFRNTWEIIKREYAQNTGKTFTTIEY